MANKFNFDFIDKKAGDHLWGSAITPEDIKGKIVEIPIKDLVEYHNHTFKVLDNDDMEDLVASIKENGIITPLTVRKKDDKYEIIAGHRRKFASEKAGLKKLPCVVLDIDDNAADILMVDSNFQREHILPSEKAFSYKVKLDALKRQGSRTDLANTEAKDSIQSLSDDSGESKSKIQRFIRLTYLKPELLDMVDNGDIAVTAGYLLSFATEATQEIVLEVLKETKRPISIEVADKIKTMSLAKGDLTKKEIVSAIKGKSSTKLKVSFNERAFKDLLPKEVKKMSPEKRLNYHKRALVAYAEYVKEHPEELDEL